MRKTWRLLGFSDTFIIGRRFDMSADKQALANLQYLAMQLDRWLADPFSQKILLDIYESVRGQSAALARRMRGYDLQRYVKAQLLEAFQRGELVALREPHVGVIPLAKEEAEEAPPEEAPPPVTQKKTWIEIEMVDEEGNPVPNIRYRLELPDGSMRGGNLDSNGRARISGIESGTCKVLFPDLDADAWETA